MEWMWNAMWARVGWAVGEILTAILFLTVMVIAFVAWVIWAEWKQGRCQHERWTMTGPGQSEKRCRDCDKRLPT